MYFESNCNGLELNRLKIRNNKVGKNAGGI